MLNAIQVRDVNRLKIVLLAFVIDLEMATVVQMHSWLLKQGLEVSLEHVASLVEDLETEGLLRIHSYQPNGDLPVATQYYMVLETGRGVMSHRFLKDRLKALKAL